MRTLIILTILSICQLSNAQSDLEIIKVKNSDKSVIVSVKNSGIIEYQVIVNIDLEGLKSDEELPLTKLIMPQSTKQLTVLRPTGKGKTSYSINFKTLEGDELSNLPMKASSGITIYTKNSHKRSTQLSIYLEQNGIEYNQINTSYDSKSKQVFENMLEVYNLVDEKYKLPVVVYNGEVFHNIKNVKKFCKEHFADEGKYVKKSERRY